MITKVEEVDLSLSNTSCRILTLSSSLVQATSLVRRIVSYRSDSPSPSSSNDQFDDSALPDLSGSSGLIKIPWTISNKYYSADVHFAICTVHGLSTHQFMGVPAVVFVWTEGQPYQDDIIRISQDMAESEPEVCLAIKVLTPSFLADSSPQDSNDNSDIDAFLSSHGFEYIDATKDPSKTLDGGKRMIHLEDIPRLPRVLDALSTIMWSSMRSISKDYSPNSDGQRRKREFLDWSQSSIGDSISAIEDIMTNPNNQQLDAVGGMKSEMRELARWLDEDNLPHLDPWRSATSTEAISMSPTSTEFKDGVFGLNDNNRTSASGFDDDFTVFISAPSADPDHYSGTPSPENSPWTPSTFLAPVPAGDLYRSLGSVSDLGGSEDGKQGEGTEDVDLPTEAEIRATSSRIFGTDAVLQTPILHNHNSAPHSVTEHEVSQRKSTIDLDLVPGDDKPYDMAPFDLERVLNTLQEMKSEIANIEDEGEKRKAAAKVALGLVYGLEADASDHL